jgi:hypothetical protein
VKQPVHLATSRFICESAAPAWFASLSAKLLALRNTQSIRDVWLTKGDDVFNKIKGSCELMAARIGGQFVLKTAYK